MLDQQFPMGDRKRCPNGYHKKMVKRVPTCVSVLGKKEEKEKEQNEKEQKEKEQKEKEQKEKEEKEKEQKEKEQKEKEQKEKEEKEKEQKEKEQKEKEPKPKEPAQKKNKTHKQTNVLLPCGKGIRCPKKTRCFRKQCRPHEPSKQKPVEPTPPEPVQPIEPVVPSLSDVASLSPINTIVSLSQTSSSSASKSKSPSSSSSSRKTQKNTIVSIDSDKYLYPQLGDPDFQANIAERKEFADIFINKNNKNGKRLNSEEAENEAEALKKRADESCAAEFEAAPHQVFVHHFLSQETPYNSLLLYHGLGTGKTCSAIGVAEEMRYYMKQLNIQKKIIVVAFPNVQDNFRRQLFDESKLSYSRSQKTWSIDASCVGAELLKEIDPHMRESRDTTKESIRLKMNRLINRYYDFQGYTELANRIGKIVDDKTNAATMERRIHAEFDNRLIIIDEVHNIRKFQEGSGDLKILNYLTKIAKVATNMRLVLLSATPIYNSTREIVPLANLLLVNDGRPTINAADVFDVSGELTPGGAAILRKSLMGYISHVRGENPESFPFRVYPSQIPAHRVRSILQQDYPRLQIHGDNPIPDEGKIRFLDVYTTPLSKNQEQTYNFLVHTILFRENEKRGEKEEEEGEEGEDLAISVVGDKKWGYQSLQGLLQSLDIVFPVSNDDNQTFAIGAEGLKKVMEYKESDKEIKMHYRNNVPHIFEPKEIAKYSSKIDAICGLIEAAEGIVLVFAEYIWGGIVPIALALEERGFKRFSPPDGPGRKNLLRQSKVAAVAAAASAKKSYTMITGVESLSPNNAADVKFLSGESNKEGEQVKVILISTAGSEGLDFKNIRQIHIMDPWYTMNRIEQIIGRGVRNGSHCALPWEKRNVEIYMHASIINLRETADLYLYRYAEKKAQQIGQVTRLLKEISVDCILNKNKDSNLIPKHGRGGTVTQRLSSDPKKTIEIVPQDHPHTAICDYKCAGERALIPHDSTYSLSFLKYNRAKWADAIRDLFRNNNTIVFSVNQVVKTLDGPREEIDYAIKYLATNALEYVHDSLGRRGTILLVEDRYVVFQPMELLNMRASVYERSQPAKYFPDSIDVGALFSTKVAEKPVIDVKNTIVVLNQFVERVLKGGDDDDAEDEDKQSWIAQAEQAVSRRPIYGLNEDAIERHLVCHFVDELSLEEKVSLFSVEEQDSSSPDHAKYLGNYWDKLSVKVQGQGQGKVPGPGQGKGQGQGPDWRMVYDKATGKNAYFYWDGKKWRPSTAASFDSSVDAKKLIKTAKWLPRAYKDHAVGFMAKHDDEVVFKVIKNKRSVGIQLYNGYSTKEIDKIFQEYVTTHLKIEKIEKDTEYAALSAKGKVVLLELLMRQHGDLDPAEKRALFDEFSGYEK